MMSKFSTLDGITPSHANPLCSASLYLAGHIYDDIQQLKISPPPPKINPAYATACGCLLFSPFFFFFFLVLSPTSKDVPSPLTVAGEFITGNDW